mmetsp:Transcript_14934/g.18421  ORF Transcript_14934/g.18421 Transcript_14934/m.18421 type:complete len:378 (-) Transcript_14934:204-1337(-)
MSTSSKGLSVGKGNPDVPSAQRVLMLVCLYATCSSSLSIVNKWAILALPYPGIVTACQFFATAASVWCLGQAGILKVEAIEKDRLWKMAPINIVFYLAIFTNGKVLQYSTVETFIAFRSMTPLLVSFLDTVARGESPPSFRTVCCLLAIAAGAASYAYEDANFSIIGYAWACIYLAIIVTEMVYAKHITSTIGLSTWGLVLYQNVIALMLFPIASIVSGEFYDIAQLFISGPGLTGAGATHVHHHYFRHRRLNTVDLSSTEEKEEDNILIDPTFTIKQIQPFFMIPLLLSCLLGVGISFAGWGTRSAITATQFTVLGVACKLVTVGMNLIVWQHHAPFLAQLSIILCIVASVLYNQSAKRDKIQRENIVSSIRNGGT